MLNDLTSRDAVLAAVQEFDSIGRDAFLSKYGYGSATRYFLEVKGRSYDSKAIVGAAYGVQHPNRGPLRPSDFSGGEATVKARLEALGFKVVVLAAREADAGPGGDWSLEEVADTVADYFEMLEHELRGETYNKRERNRALQQVVSGRSAGAIEFKRANISAVLIALGFPYIDGYKPRGNYQELLKSEVEARLLRDTRLSEAAKAVVASPAPQPPPVQSLADIMVPAPKRDIEGGRTYERKASPAPTPRHTNYLEIEARNASLGRAGELFALEVEHKRLWETGRRDLADRVEHVSRIQGDGLGYDILSFEADGRERLIEVKTTNFGQLTPFFVSRLEVAVSVERSHQFNLYRVFGFRESPKLFVLPGSLRESCTLDPVQYKASLI